MILLDAGVVCMPHYDLCIVGRERCSRHPTLTLPCKQGRGLRNVSLKRDANPTYGKVK